MSMGFLIAGSVKLNKVILVNLMIKMWQKGLRFAILKNVEPLNH
jgi:hypothetical protein